MLQVNMAHIPSLSKTTPESAAERRRCRRWRWRAAWRWPGEVMTLAAELAGGRQPCRRRRWRAAWRWPGGGDVPRRRARRWTAAMQRHGGGVELHGGGVQLDDGVVPVGCDLLEVVCDGSAARAASYQRVSGWGM